MSRVRVKMQHGVEDRLCHQSNRANDVIAATRQKRCIREGETNHDVGDARQTKRWTGKNAARITLWIISRSFERLAIFWPKYLFCSLSKELLYLCQIMSCTFCDTQGEGLCVRVCLWQHTFRRAMPPPMCCHQHSILCEKKFSKSNKEKEFTEFYSTFFLVFFFFWIICPLCSSFGWQTPNTSACAYVCVRVCFSLNDLLSLYLIEPCSMCTPE